MFKLAICASNTLVVLHRGRLIADGAPAGVLADPAVIEAYLGHRCAERQRSGSGGA